MSALHPNFKAVIQRTHESLRNYARVIHTERWQGLDISKRPEAEMRELLFWDFRVVLPTEDLDHYRQDIGPHLPWADDHFEERVCGYPMNPGEQWKNWPFALSADKFRDENGLFEVNYMERIWAGGPFENTPKPGERTQILTGIRGRPYGDMNDVINLLLREPLTRQAYLPIFFPEDTGGKGRVPCTLGWWWMMRNNNLNVYYPIRSCDYHRHFRDDIYLCVRLTLWLLDQLRARDPKTWKKVKPGMYHMWIGSLHVFVNDYQKLFK